MELLPLFVNLRGRKVLLVGGGPVAAAKLHQLAAVGAEVVVVAPEVIAEIGSAPVVIHRRPFVPTDLDDVWMAVAAATPAVNAQVARAAEVRRVIVNAVDDPPNAAAYFGSVVRRGGITIAISTSGAAPALAALVRESIDALLPDETGEWVETATRIRADWRERRVPMDARRPLLLDALNRLYAARIDDRCGR